MGWFGEHQQLEIASCAANSREISVVFEANKKFGKKKSPSCLEELLEVAFQKNTRVKNLHGQGLDVFFKIEIKLPYRPSVMEKNPLGGWYQVYFPKTVLRNQDFLGPSPPTGAASSWAMFGEHES